MRNLWKVVRVAGALAAGALLATQVSAGAADKTMSIGARTAEPTRFVVRGSALVDLAKGGRPVFFRGMGYSPYQPGETPLYGAPPGRDERYARDVKLMKGLGVNYLHVFPQLMPENFFAALDRTDMAYGQDVWIWPYQEDLLDPAYQAKTLADIKGIIDHTYKTGRPDRLVLFSIGDELQASAVMQTDGRHPTVRDFKGKHLSLTNRTPSEIAMAMLVDAAMDYELERYGRRHLYCHTSWTHIGPISDRPDLDVGKGNVLLPDMGDLFCLNIYTYANGVRTSPKGSVTGSTYQGYLEQLARELDKPILVTQAGLSTSPIAPKPWVPGFGGHKVDDVPKTFRAIWKDIRTAKGHETFAGLVFFELHDEWWKSGDNPIDFKSHEDNDPEEWFGLYLISEDGRLTPKGDIPKTVKKLFTGP